MRSLWIAVLVSAAIACGWGVSAAGSEPRRGVTAEAADLGKCPKHVPPRRLRCGMVVVPLERADPSLGTIPITFAVREPGDRDRPALGTIFAVEGGPGPGASAPDAPTLVVSGELDDVTSPTEGMMVAAAFPNSRFMLVHGAGHVSSLYGGRYPSRDRVRMFISRWSSP
jgi:pimeloyl-ACP methyl ester carboxylesterase